MSISKKYLVAMLSTILFPAICAGEEISIGVVDPGPAMDGPNSTTEAGKNAPDTLDTLECPVCPEFHCDCQHPVSISEFENMQNNLDSCLAERITEEQMNSDRHSQIILELKQARKEVISKSQEIDKISSEFKEKLQALEEKIASDKKSHENYKRESIRRQSDYNEVLSKLSALEGKQESIRNNQQKKLNVFKEKAKSSAKDAQKNKDLYDRMKDKYHDERERVTAMEKEMRMMHHRSRTTYFNTTLVMEDTMRITTRYLDKAVFTYDNAMRHPKVQDFIEFVTEKSYPILTMMSDFYKNNIAAYSDAAFEKVTKIEAFEGVRLCIISMTKQFATVALNYIELTRDDRYSSRFQRRLVSRLEYVEDDAESCVHNTFTAILGLLMLRVVFMLCLLPFRFIRGKKMKSGKKNKKSNQRALTPSKQKHE